MTARPDLAAIDFDQTPFLVIWETTRACDLACLHCRASAIARRDPRELSTGEARRLLDTVRGFGRPLFVLTGGDPLKRDDTVELVRYGASIGLRMAMTPSGTPLMTPEVLESLSEAGLSRLAVSLDGATAAQHDGFRGVPGSFDWTIRMLETARALGISTQINTTISSHNVDDLEALITLMERLGIALWSVFFIVPTGRARVEDLATAGEFERVFNRLYDLSATAPFDIKTTAAPHYRRVIMQRQRAERRSGDRAETPIPLTAGIGFSLRDGVGRAKGVNDGDGFVFVSHRGEIYPSGFMPVSAGNVRTDDLVEVYRTHPLFRSLRDRDQLKGKCGMCEFRSVCGGSRARAYAMTGDALASDPLCAYQPPAWVRFGAKRGPRAESPNPAH
ncbi:MAG: TIGR04053 family radical SAM/SPASM domain-containing protein [Gemmatimonadaceae bacterium]|nr:TIGR04053 family radical SAM/SPASM domain-containing protein [Gemmatimonadaceae bacterium]